MADKQGGALRRMAGWTVWHRLAAAANRVPLPYSRWPVRLGAVRLTAHRLDRFAALWLWRWGMGGYEAGVLRSLCRPGMTVADVGANIGCHTLQLAQWVGPAGRVWAFEPDPGNFTMLRANVERNDARNVELRPCAVGAASRQSALWISPSHGGDHRIYASRDNRGWRQVAVDVVALDDLFGPDRPLDLIKMDIQGAEGLALAGMARLLATRPTLAILTEFWPAGLRQAGTDPVALLQDLRTRGFALHLADTRRRELTPVDDPAAFVARIAPGVWVDLVARKG
jgi:FkbM family methyltransferase